MDNLEEIKKILDEPVITTDGGSHYIDENHKRYLASLIAALQPQIDGELELTIDEEETLRQGWRKLDPNTRISWRDYWLQAQIRKCKSIIEARVRAELARVREKIAYEVDVHYPMASQASKNYTTDQILNLFPYGEQAIKS